VPKIVSSVFNAAVTQYRPPIIIPCNIPHQLNHKFRITKLKTSVSILKENMIYTEWNVK